MNLSHTDSTPQRDDTGAVEERRPIAELRTPTLTLPELIAWVEERLREDERGERSQEQRDSDINLLEAA